MERDCLGLIAAMPQEIAPLLQRVRRYKKERATGFNLYRFSLAGCSVVLIESGMGPTHATDATRVLISVAGPRVLVNFGFAGGVLPGLRVGELVLAERAYRLEGSRITEAPRPDATLSRIVADACRNGGVDLRTGSFITACGIINKGELAASIKAELALPVLEMETTAVLQVAHEAGIPVLALRGVSDAADEELGFSIEELCDRELNLSPTRLILTLARKPYLVPQLIRLAGNARKAGRGLAQGVELALQALSGNPKD